MIHVIGGNLVKTERLRSLRERRGLSQGEAAKKMGIVRTTYSNYEAGNREPDNDTLKKIAEFFEVSTDYLLGRESTGIINDQTKNAALEIYSRLPQEDKTLIDDMIKALEKRREK
jgi:transcriptional regulator with XRE-family HTH domain